MKRSLIKNAKPHARRLSCPLALTLDIIGDRWTMLIIRDLAVGSCRFKDLAVFPEPIPTNVLSNRLERLQQEQIVVQVPVAEGSKRLAYKLTSKGETLLPVLSAMQKWGARWVPVPETSPDVSADRLPRRKLPAPARCQQHNDDNDNASISDQTTTPA